MSSSASTASGSPLEVKVWGEFACFTRPETKAERVSYPVMTPSAARGVLEAIFWKPEFRWMIREIAVLQEPAYFSILRNEVSSRATEEGARNGYYADQDRTQRHTLALRAPAYVIRADVALRPDVTDDPAKYRDQFRRRVDAGQCHRTPYLGCREFAASFGPPGPEDRPAPLDQDLGLMLFDLDYEVDASGRPTGRGTPRFFSARLERGVLRVPADLYAPRKVIHAAR